MLCAPSIAVNSSSFFSSFFLLFVLFVLLFVLFFVLFSLHLKPFFYPPTLSVFFDQITQLIFDSTF
jgi:ABC-type transporter Mla subunit MlaD